MSLSIKTSLVIALLSSPLAHAVPQHNNHNQDSSFIKVAKPSPEKVTPGEQPLKGLKPSESDPMNIPNNPEQMTPQDRPRNSPIPTPTLPTPKASPLNPDEDQEQGNDNPNVKLPQAPIPFSQDLVLNQDVKVTQIRIRDRETMNKAGIKEAEILEFVSHFEQYARNFFFKYPSSGGKILFMVSIAPALEQGLIKYIEQGGDVNDESKFLKMCTNTPTNCSLTSIASFQNGKIKPSVMSNFEMGVYDESHEIYWRNWSFNDPEAKVEFFFEITLKS